MAVRLRSFDYGAESLVRPVFIETGTFEGETLEYARQAGFGELHSIEICERHFQAAKAKFCQYANVHCHLGSSPELLPKIINSSVRTTFWLDAHYQGGPSFEQDPIRGECPLLEELRIIFSFDWSPIVLIDDAHMFDYRIPPGFNRAQWPTFEEIREEIPMRYGLREFNGVLYCTEK